MTHRILLSSVSGLLLAALSHASISITSFGPAVFNPSTATMDAALGITGYTIESFNDTTLAAGLTYELSAPSAYGPAGVTPATVLSTVNGATFDNHWDDAFMLVNNNTNTFPDSGVRAFATTFFVPAGTTSVGVGVSSAQSASLPNQFPIADHELFINGVSFGLLETYSGFVPGRNRNLYVRIDATGADTISNVRITTLNNRDDELMVFDHIAFIPEPKTLALLGFGAFAIVCRRRH